MSAEQIGALAALLTALAGVLTVVLVQARRVHIEDREQRHKEHADELAEIKAQTAYTQEQLTPNHGSSTRDAINRAEETTREIAERMSHNSEQIAAVGVAISGMSEDVRQIAREIEGIRTTITFNDNKADRTHSEIFRRLREIEGGGK